MLVQGLKKNEYPTPAETLEITLPSQSPSCADSIEKTEGLFSIQDSKNRAQISLFTSTWVKGM